MSIDLTKQELLALATTHPELEKILATTPPKKSFDEQGNDIKTIRVNLAAAKKALTAATAATGDVGYVEEDRKIPVRDGSRIAIRIHSPKLPPADGCPGLVVYHGGGFCLGGLDNEVALCRKWTEFGGVAVNVDYRLAPEHPFPIPVEDAYDALVWTSQHTSNLGINPKKGFVAAGISAGANFVAVVSHLYRDAGLSPPLTGQYLSIPTVCDALFIPNEFKDMFLSHDQCKSALVLNQGSLDMFDRLYNAEANSPLRSPILFPSHEGLPSAYLQVCGADPLRDEGLIYEKLLKRNGVKTRLDIFKGLSHSFWSFWPETDFSRDFQIKTQEGLRWLLEQV
ncbi:hypothetical protein B7463_g10313, partial [Scytalidium lignicola]